MSICTLDSIIILLIERQIFDLLNERFNNNTIVQNQGFLKVSSFSLSSICPIQGSYNLLKPEDELIVLIAANALIVVFGNMSFNLLAAPIIVAPRVITSSTKSISSRFGIIPTNSNES